MKIIQQSYEEARLCFFKEQRKIAERKLEYWINAMRTGRHGYSQAEYEDRCCSYGSMCSYYDDVLRMLDGENDGDGARMDGGDEGRWLSRDFCVHGTREGS